jgi:hypothetical protein
MKKLSEAKHLQLKRRKTRSDETNTSRGNERPD